VNSHFGRGGRHQIDLLAAVAANQPSCLVSMISYFSDPK
jgi:hypothetical protein